MNMNDLEYVGEMKYSHFTVCKPEDCRPWCNTRLLRLRNNPRWPLRDAP